MTICQRFPVWLRDAYLATTSLRPNNAEDSDRAFGTGTGRSHFLLPRPHRQNKMSACWGLLPNLRLPSRYLPLQRTISTAQLFSYNFLTNPPLLTSLVCNRRQSPSHAS
jgi:hypothetical protein